MKPLAPPPPSGPGKALGAPRSFREQLAAIAVANRQVQAQAEADGGGTVTVDQTYPGWMAPVVALFALRRQRCFRLDPIAWGLLQRADGTRTLLTEVEAVAAEHRLTFHEARVLVLACLALLMQRGVVVLATPGMDKPR